MTGPLDDVEKAALLEALDDEHRAWATYRQVLQDFGEVNPFANIVEAEARHIAALEALCAKYGVPVPANPWPGRVPRYGSVRAACEAGVDAEVANAALYDTLLDSTTRADLLTVFRNLQSASQDRHLPAFQRCAAREGGGRGRGAGRRTGRCG